jgi:hypothetical protein
MRDRTLVVRDRDLAAYDRGLVVRDQEPEVLGCDCCCCDLDHEWIDQILGVVLGQRRRIDGDRDLRLSASQPCDTGAEVRDRTRVDGVAHGVNHGVGMAHGQDGGGVGQTHKGDVVHDRRGRDRGGEYLGMGCNRTLNQTFSRDLGLDLGPVRIVQLNGPVGGSSKMCEVRGSAHGGVQNPSPLRDLLLGERPDEGLEGFRCIEIQVW